MKRILVLCLMMLVLRGILPGQDVAVKTDLNNVFFRTLENPVLIVVEKQPARKVVARAKFGKLTQQENSSVYMYLLDDCSIKEDQIFVGIKTSKGVKWIDSTTYRVVNPTSPLLYVSGQKGGTTNKEQILAAPVLSLILEDYFIDTHFRVDTFSVEAYRNDSLIYTEDNVAGNRFSSQLTQFLQNTDPGYKLRFFAVRGSGPGCKCWDKFSQIILKIE